MNLAYSRELILGEGSRPHRRRVALIIGMLIAGAALLVPPWQTAERLAEVEVMVEVPAGERVSATTVDLGLDDRIAVKADTASATLPLRLEIRFLGRLIVDSGGKGQVGLAWTANGDAVYSIDVLVEEAEGSPAAVRVSYSIDRPVYVLPHLRPVLLVFSIAVITGAVAWGRGGSRQWQADAAPRSSRGRFHRLINIMIQHRYLIVVFVASTAIGLALFGGFVHNDEVGGNRTEWGYFAWGSLDTSQQIADLLRASDYVYASWFEVDGNGKPILANLLMALHIIGLPALAPIHAARLSVILLGAAGMAVFFALLKRTVGLQTALLATGLLLFSPIFLNYRATTYLEIPFFAFASFFLYSIHVWSRSRSPAILILAGVFMGMAMAVKSPAFLWVLGAVAFIWLWFSPLLSSVRIRARLLRVAPVLVLLALLAAGTFAILWPITWSWPLGRFATMGLFGTGFLVGQEYQQFPLPSVIVFGFLGPQNPFLSPWIYILMQTTYVELAGFVMGMIVLLARLKSKALSPGQLVWLGTFAVLLLSSMAVGNLLQHRFLYLLVSYDVIAALGISLVASPLLSKAFFAFRGSIRGLRGKWRPERAVAIAGAALLLFHAALVIPVGPYYGTYRNEAFLLGAPYETLFSLAEPVYGLREAGEYLAGIVPEGAPVLTTDAPHILQFYLPDWAVYSMNQIPPGSPSELLSSLQNLSIAYLIVTLSWLQLNPGSPITAMLSLPEFSGGLLLTVQAADLNLAWVYAVPPRDITQAPTVGAPLGESLWFG